MLALGKAYKSHAAILLLCESGYGEDAAILSRSLFELAITTVYISADESNARAQRYFDYDWVIRDEMYNHLLSTDELKAELEKRTVGTDAKVEEVQRRAKEVRAGYTADELRKRNWSGKSIRDMAIDVGREDAYKTAYRLQCSLAHSDITVADNYIKETGDQLMMDISPNENWVPSTLVATIDFFLGIVRAWNSVYAHGLDDRLVDFETRYVAAVGDLNKRRTGHD